jgi:hypothetical protein
MPRIAKAFPVRTALLLVIAGCGPRPEPSLPPAEGSLPPDLVPAAEVVGRDGLDPSANGIEALTWSVGDDEAAIAAAFRRHAVREGDPVSAAGIDRDALRREGFRIEALPKDSLVEFLSELGGTTVALSVWHGQAVDWRELAHRRLDGPTVAMSDGRARRIDAGWLRLLLRGWTLPLEDGAVSESSLELRWVPDAAESGRILLRRPARRAEPQTLLGPFRIEIPREFCVLVTSRPPEAAGDADGREEPPPRPEIDAEAVRTGGAGPPVELPPTLGEILLREPGTPPRRTILVLRPRLPDTLFPPVTRLGVPERPSPP